MGNANRNNSKVKELKDAVDLVCDSAPDLKKLIDKKLYNAIYKCVRFTEHKRPKFDREAENRKAREWRARNKDKVSAANKRYREKKKREKLLNRNIIAGIDFEDPMKELEDMIGGFKNGKARMS